MTNHWIDIKNSNCIMIIGSNAAENHPLSFKRVTEAMEKGAKLISAALLIDPDFKGPADLDGLFCGYDASKRAYDRSKWVYQLDDKGIPQKDISFKDPNCVFRLLTCTALRAMCYFP